MASQILSSVLLGLLAIQGLDDREPAALVAKLGSSRFREREEAGEALIRLGRAAMPALAKAAASTDAEIRSRAPILIARIEAGEILDAARSRIEIRDLPLGEAVEAFSEAFGDRITPGGRGKTSAAEPGWPDRRVTLEAPESIPFWDALDRLCITGGLQREYPPAGTNIFPAKPPFSWGLMPGQARPPASTTGALRVELLRIRYRRDRDYSDGDSDFYNFTAPLPIRDKETGATEKSSYAAELLVSAEPRLRIFQVGEIEKPEVVDDRGRSLLRIPTREEETRQQEFLRMNPHLDPRNLPVARFGTSRRQSARNWPVSVALSYPSPPPGRIATLRGSIPVAVIARRPDPLVVDLKGAVGKDFSAGSSRITVHKIDAEGGREPTVEFTLESEQPGDGSTMIICDTNGVRTPVHVPLDLMELRLEVLDGRGERVSWQYTRAPDRGGQGRMAIVIHNRNQGDEPPDKLRLRYWGVVGASTDLPFAFKDVPTP